MSVLIALLFITESVKNLPEQWQKFIILHESSSYRLWFLHSYTGRTRSLVTFHNRICISWYIIKKKFIYFESLKARIISFENYIIHVLRLIFRYMIKLEKKFSVSFWSFVQFLDQNKIWSIQKISKFCFSIDGAIRFINCSKKSWCFCRKSDLLILSFLVLQGILNHIQHQNWKKYVCANLSYFLSTLFQKRLYHINHLFGFWWNSIEILLIP